MTSVLGGGTVYEEVPVGGQITHHGTNNVTQTVRQCVNLLTAGRACHDIMFSDISYEKLLSATQLIESMKDLCACDVSVDELVGASQQIDVFFVVR